MKNLICRIPLLLILTFALSSNANATWWWGDKEEKKKDEDSSWSWKDKDKQDKDWDKDKNKNWGKDHRDKDCDKDWDKNWGNKYSKQTWGKDHWNKKCGKDDPGNEDPGNEDPGNGGNQQAHVQVTKVLTDLDGNEIYIHGQGFESKDAPRVFLADAKEAPGIELQVMSYTGAMVTAWAPDNLEFGDYSLRVETGPGQKHQDTFDYTFGSAGGEGTEGPEGPAGEDGADGVSVVDATVNDNGELVLTLSDGTTINAGKVQGTGTGTDGEDGVSVIGAELNDDFELILSLSDDSTINVGNVRGPAGEGGADGLTVTGATVTNDELVLTLSDGSTINAGNVVGPAGPAGSDGQDGTDGVSVTGASLSGGDLVLTLSDGGSINVGNVQGPAGEDGTDGTDGVSITGAGISNGNLVLSFSDGTTVNVGNVVGPAGVSIIGAEVNTDGILVLSFSNGTTLNAGSVVGPAGTDGSDGVSVTDAAVNTSGELVLTLSDGSTINAGEVQGPQGEPGPAGSGLSADDFTLGDDTVPSAVVAGNKTGTPFNITCPEGSMLTGILARDDNAYITTIEGRCQAVANVSLKLSGLTAAMSTATTTGERGAFSTTPVNDTNCQAGYVATGMNAYVDSMSQEFGEIHKLEAVCTRLFQGTITDTTSPIGAPASESIPVKLRCPEGKAAVGISGYNDNIIQYLELSCR